MLVGGLLLLTGPSAAQSTAITGIHVVGQPVLVFDHLVDKREPDHIPDLPATAWKEADGTVNVTVNHFEWYRLRGSDLESVASDPRKIFSSRTNASDVVESHYNYHHWPAAPYTFDGRTIYALSHTEWYACLLAGDCNNFQPPTAVSTGNYYLNSWANTLNSMVSSDGGASWAMNGLNGAHVVSNESFTWTGSQPLADGIYRVATNHSGNMSPSRIIKEGNYYYAFSWLNHRDFAHINAITKAAPIDKYDWVLMRTTNPAQAAGWEGWVSGSNWVPMVSHGFTAFSPRMAGGGMNAGQAQMIYDTNAHLYIAIFVVWGTPGPIYYVTTPSLANPVWSDAVAIGGSAGVQINPRTPASCSTGFMVTNYVSIIDSHSDGFNFEFTDGDPWLFYAFNPALNCQGDNLARDMYRLRLSVDYAAGPRPAFTTQPADQRVVPGGMTQITVSANGAQSLQWQISTDSGVSWTNIANGGAYSGATTATLSIAGPSTGLDALRFRCVATNGIVSATSNAVRLRPARPMPNDFDGDGKSDLAVWRQSNGWWYARNSATQTFTAQQWGIAAPPYDDVPVPGDYDGDGKTDLAVWRRANGWWYIINSSTGAATAMQWGNANPPYDDVPVPGDYDGDGRTDIAIWRRENGWWFVANSSTQTYTATQWGLADPGYDDVPVPGDYDGDGKTDFAVWRRANGWWYIINSSTGLPTAVQWGNANASYSDVPVPGDYDGDGKTDIAVWRQANGWWFVLKSATNTSTATPWGVADPPYNDVPVPGDYDGDGKTDLAVWRQSNGWWYVLNSSAVAPSAVQWGIASAPYNDIPAASYPGR